MLALDQSKKLDWARSGPIRGLDRSNVVFREDIFVISPKMAIKSSTASTTAFNTKPKVLVPEKLSPDGLALLRKTLEVDERKGLNAEEILKVIPEYDALIVRSETKVIAALLEAGRKLKLVARAGVGVDNVGTYISCLQATTLLMK